MKTEEAAGRGPALLLILAGVFAFVWAVVRASVQSITLDEADTYFWFVARPGSIFYPFPNNHVLNTLLIWITTHVFGTSSLTVRMPALLGALVYISACYFLCRSLTNRFSLQLPIFICLVYNPFIFDFMVAARGYSMANAFLLAAIAVPVWHHLKGRPSLSVSCGLASLALALSFIANFSFGLVDLAALLAIAIWALCRRRTESIVRILGWCVLPGLFVALSLCGYTLLHWPRSELWYGARSLHEMTQSLMDASLYRLDPRFGGHRLLGAMSAVKPLLIPTLAILSGCQFVATWRDMRTVWQGKLAGALAGITGLSVLLHWLAFRFDKLPLPMTRTGIFLIPLVTLLAGAIASAPARSSASHWLRRGITATFVCLAFYFLLCFRTTYFKEYEFDAEVKDVYSVLAQLNHRYGVTEVATDGVYVNSLNFCRVVSKKETFPEFKYMPARELPPGWPIYVIDQGWERELMDKEGLVIIYWGKTTGVVIAVKPGGAIPLIRMKP